MANPLARVVPRVNRGVERLREPFREFIRAQSTSSGLLLVALAAALVAANSPLSEFYEALKRFPVGIVLGGEVLQWSLRHFVNDGLITVFFFLIGLEVKRELLAGELRDRDRVRLLFAAAAGGMLAPAAVYALINTWSTGGEPGGWGIPMATDTAIAIGVLVALGRRVPPGIVAFVAGVAILDDIGAILVIALVYTERLAPAALLTAAALVTALLLANRIGLRHPLIYAAGGVALWLAVVRSGIHASIAGVVVAATVPAHPRLEPPALRSRLRRAVDEVPREAGRHEVLAEARTHEKIVHLERLAQAGTTPLRRWESGMELPVALLVLPTFAFLNAGVAVDTSMLAALLRDPVTLGVGAGLVLGKPLGVIAGIHLAERLDWARRPRELTERRLLGVGLLAGIGFTMSTFIANLALGADSDSIALAKLAIVVASAIAATAGYAVLRAAARAD